MAMKKIMTLIMALIIVAASTAPVFAQRRSRYRSYAPVAYSQNYQARGYYDYHHRSFWDKHRDKLTLGIGTGAGALFGGLIGGGKGAGIGALTGLGGSALYTYKIRNRHHWR
jgi:hypothetical protein